MSESSIIQPNPNGSFSLSSVARTDLRQVDISDIDIVLTTKSGARYLLPGGGIAAMQEPSPTVNFSDGSISISKLLMQVGAAVNVATDAPMPSSIPLDKPPPADEELLKQLRDLQHKMEEQQKQLQQQKHQIEQQSHQLQKPEKNEAPQNESQHSLATLNANTAAGVEQMVEKIAKIQENLHKSDYDYVPPTQFHIESSVATPPPGVPAPISMTPIVNLFMGNVVGTTVSTTDNPGYTTYYGGGGAVGSDALGQLGPRNALQFSAAEITAGDENCIIYTEGPLVGNTNPAMDHTTYYAKEFSLNIAGYFITLDDISIKNVPEGVSIGGATYQGNGVWVLPKDVVLTNGTFTIVYDTGLFSASGDNTFDLEFDISGQTTRGATFSSKQHFRFQFMNVTNVNQVTDPTLIWDSGGLVKEIYILPCLDQPNVITVGDGDDIIYGSRSNDTITTGDGDNQIVDGNGTNTITTGDGNSSITSGDGNNTIAVGNGNNVVTIGGGTNTVNAGNGANTIVSGNGKNTITVGTGVNTITTGTGDDVVVAWGGGGTFDLGTGNNQITINSSDGSTNIYTLTTSGNGTNTITGGDNLYNITMGSGTNTVTIGDGTDAYNTQITTGAGANTITTGNGWHTIDVGAGACAITTGSGRDDITTGGGGGTINAGAGDNTVTINSTTGSTHQYTISTSGAGTNTITGGDDYYTIALGSGTNTVQIGNGNSSITAGDGDNTIKAKNGALTATLGSGTNDITTETGLVDITTGDGANSVTTSGGGGTINLGGGTAAKSITINSSSGSTANYTLTTSGSGTTNIQAGDSNYTISAGSGVNTISIGSGTSSITTGASADSITTGDGAMTIAAGAGNNVINTGTGSVSITAGAGDDTVVAVGGGGTISLGNGANSVTAGGGNYTITTGTGNDTITTGNGNNVINAGAGTNSITVGNGNNTIVGGSGNDTINMGYGNNTIKAGLGTNVINGGSGTNTMDFSDINSSLTINVGNGTTHGSATGTGVSDDFVNISTILGTNYGDSITLTGGTRTVYGGSGNDIIYCGSGTDTIYGGAGNNTIYGGTVAGFLYGGSGNNTFLTPVAGTYYNGTNGEALSAVTNNVAFSISNNSANPFVNATNIPDTVSYICSGGVTTINLQLQVQLNKVDYSGYSGATGINLQNGTGSGGTAQGSTYAFYATGYNTINYIVVGNGTDSITPSFTDSVLVGGTGSTYFYDHNITLGSQNIIIRGNQGGATSNWDYVYMGNARETIVGNPSSWVELIYAGSKGIVSNLDSVSHTFTSTLYTTPITVAAYSGSNWGANETGSATSFSTGDYYVPVSGTSTRVVEVYMNSSVNSIVYGPSNTFYFYGAGASDYFYGNTSVSSGTWTLYGMSAGNDVFVGGSGFNIFYSRDTYNIFTIFSKTLEGTAAANGWISQAQYTKDNAVNLSYGGTTYTEFAYGWGNATNPATSAKTYMSNVENVLGYSGNDFIIGDNNGNQINARTGTNTIVTGTGANIITAIEGNNTIYSTGTNNTLNFETSNNAYSGSLAGSSPASTAGVQVFLNNSSPTTFFNTGDGGDQAAFWGGTTYTGLQARTGATGAYSYDLVQDNIINMINGGTYSSGTSENVNNSTFYYDHVYSGAPVIRAHGGNSIFIDNMGTSSETFYGGTGSDLYYMSPTQVSHVTIVDNVNSSVNILRVPGWGNDSISGNAFGSTDPFATTKITAIDVIDVRSGIDAVNLNTAPTSSVTMGGGSIDHNGPVFYMSRQDIINVTGVASSANLYLKLDGGEIFKPTGTVDQLTVGNTTTFFDSTTDHSASHILATQVHTAGNYYSDVLTYTGTNPPHLNIHYGT